MKPAFLITPIAKSIPESKEAAYIGVDAGSLKILEKKLPLAFAVGDFDSMEAKDFEWLKNQTTCITHPVQKDETDSELAIELAYEKGYAPLTLWGALAGRMDHTLANIRLLMYRFPNLILQDETQKITCLKKGEHVLANEYTHCSFFAIEPSKVSFSGLLYELKEREVFVEDIYMVSNSFVKPQANIVVHEGSLLCIQSNER